MKSIFALCLSLCLLAGCAAPGDTPAQKRAAIQQMRTDTLTRLYKQYPEARKEVSSAAGYAVFSNVGNNLLLVSSGNGYGVVREKRSGKDSYMKMATLGVGLGLGIKDFQSVILFRDQKSLSYFIEHGWDSGVQSDATLKSGKKGGSVVDAAAAANYEKIKVYNLTASGIALQATLQGYKYWQDGELNIRKPAPVSSAR